MDLEVAFLGTSGSVPTARRAPASLVLRRGGERFLLDCGEGTQRQLLRSGIGLVELREILLTHYHADHYLGLPGMLKTFALRGRELPLTIYGPVGLRELLESLRRIFGRLTFPLELVELSPGDSLERDDHRIAAFAVDHRVPALGYALVEEPRPGRFDVEAARALGVPEGPLWGRLQSGMPVEGTRGTVTPDQVLGPPRASRKVVVTGDTRPARSVIEAAYEADVLVHDGTFGVEERERADETGHSTAADAAELARVAGVRLLALTHLSNRYFGPEILREARQAIESAGGGTHVVVPRDFDIIDVRFAERGGPELLKGGALARAAENGEPQRAAVAGVEGER
jgi:ribonuclease Z